MAIGNERNLSHINYRNCFSTDVKPLTANDGDQLYELDTYGLYEYNKGTWYFKQSYSKSAENILDLGIATDGTVNSLTDDTKNFGSDMFAGQLIKINTNDIIYYRTILSNAGNLFMFDSLEDPVPATVVVGSGEAGAEGQITIACKMAGSDGNKYSVKFVAGIGESLAGKALLDGDILIITSPTDFEGNPLPIAAGNISGYIEANLETDELFEVSIDFVAGDINLFSEPISFENGDDGVSVSAGDEYQIVKLI
jgi:hypothetical protein